MEALNFTNVLLALLGVTIHSLMKFQNRNTTDAKFSFVFWMKDNWVNTTLSFLCTLAVLFMLDDISSFVGNGTSGLVKLVAFFGGYFNQSLVRALTDKFRATANIK